MSYDNEFIETFNEFYPFERYIVKNPEKINNLFDDALLCEFFIPSTEIKPVILEEEFVGFTQIDYNNIYIKLKTLAGEIRMAYYDFNDHVREEIRRIIISDFGGYEWESLYVEHDDGDEELAKALQTQKTLIEEKYGVCPIKKNFKIEDTIAILK